MSLTATVAMASLSPIIVGAPPCLADSISMHRGPGDIHGDRAPLSPIEAPHAERTSRSVTEKNGDPDVYGIERAHSLKHKTNREGHDHLRDDRDVKRPLCVPRALQSAGVSERDGNQQAGHTQHS